MSARWLIAFGVLIVAGVGAILLISSPPAHVTFLSLEGRSEHARPGDAQASAAAASSPATGSGPVTVNPLSLDFGSVPILFPSRESFFLVNQGRSPVVVKRVTIEGPFRAETTIAQLDPNVPTKFIVSFDPKKPGQYEQRLKLTIEGKATGVQELEVLMRGRAILSPQAAGIAIPPPPDQVVRTYQTQKAARDLAAYREATENMEQVSLEGAQFPKFTGPAVAGGPEAMAPVGDAATAGGVQYKDPDHARSYAIAAIMAFGEESGPNPDDIPVPVTGGETTPELPDDDADDSANQPGDDIDQDEDGSGGQNPADEDDEQAKDDDDDADSGIFVIAPNSTVVVYSNKGAMPLQALPFSVNGSMLRLDARMTIPEFMLAFGEYVTLEQFGSITGTLSPDGTVVMSVPLKVEDSGGSSIVLPLQLTTGMAVGYSAAGRMFFDSGSKRDPVTGNVKMVGIANIPMGQGSSIEKAPIYFALLGRIQL